MGHFREKVGRTTGKCTWQYRWKAPFRKKDGTLGYRYVERSTGVSDLKTAKEKAKLFELEAANAAMAAPKEEFITFAEAATTYMKNGGERKYLGPILREIGLKPINEVDQDLVLDLCEKLHPGAKPSTWNRRIFTPISAVINFAAADKKCAPCQLKRPKGHNEAPPLAIPDDDWFEKVLPVCRPTLRAIILIITLHGLRISEAVERKPADVDIKKWTLAIPNTKTGKPVLLKLSDPVIDAIKAIPNWRSQRWLFGTGSRRNIDRNLKAAAKRAKATPFSSHAIGRHKFASSLLSEGKSLHFVKDAGRWATIKMVSERYGHLEQQQVAEEVNASAAARFGNSKATGK